MTEPGEGAGQPRRAGTEPGEGASQPRRGTTEPERRRRRLRHDGSGGGSQPGEGRRNGDPGTGAGAGDDRDAERGLRGLIGSGASQVSVAAAMRARDAARPTEADLAEAAERLVLVRRNWVPRDELPRGGR